MYTLSTETRSEQDTGARKSAPGSITHILLVEDNPNDAELAQLALRKYPRPVTIKFAVDGAEALGYLSEQAGRRHQFPSTLPNLILLDLKLPKITGLEVLASIKSDYHLRVIPVIIFTSSLETSDLTYCYAHGANGYVVKPVDYTEYTQCLHHICSFWLEYNRPPIH